MLAAGLDHLTCILEQVQGVRADMIDVKARLQRVELVAGALKHNVLGLRTEVLRLDHRLDRLDERVPCTTADLARYLPALPDNCVAGWVTAARRTDVTTNIPGPAPKRAAVARAAR